MHSQDGAVCMISEETISKNKSETTYLAGKPNKLFHGYAY
jgi:hypothetical protein